MHHTPVSQIWFVLQGLSVPKTVHRLIYKFSKWDLETMETALLKVFPVDVSVSLRTRYRTQQTSENKCDSNHVVIEKNSRVF